MLAEAAKYHSVPFVVISGMYKLSPVYPNGKNFANDMSSPGNIISFEERKSLRRCRHVPILIGQKWTESARTTLLESTF